MVLIVAPVSREDPNGTKVARVREALDESRLLQQPITASAESIFALQALGHDPCANPLLYFASHPGKLSHKLVQVHAIGNEICAISE